MSEIHYKCHLKDKEDLVEVNVFSDKELSNQEIAEKSVKEAQVFYARDFEKTVLEEEITPFGYTKGWF